MRWFPLWPLHCILLGTSDYGKIPVPSLGRTQARWLTPLMSSIPWRQTHKAEDPFGPNFETVIGAYRADQAKSRIRFRQVALRGEVSNVARPRSGHIYFTVKDDTASIRAVMWKNDSRRVAFDLTDGLAVRALGRLTVTRRGANTRSW